MIILDMPGSGFRRFKGNRVPSTGPSPAAWKALRFIFFNLFILEMVVVHKKIVWVNGRKMQGC